MDLRIYRNNPIWNKKKNIKISFLSISQLSNQKILF